MSPKNLVLQRQVNTPSQDVRFGSPTFILSELAFKQNRKMVVVGLRKVALGRWAFGSQCSDPPVRIDSY
jgi:hypothetical protein